MIRINYDELDRLIDVFIRLKSDTENTLGKTTMLRNEMLDDTEFLGSPKSGIIIGILDNSIGSLTQIDEDIRAMETLFYSAKEEFREDESKLVKAVEEISNRLDSIKTQLDATMVSNQVVVVDESEVKRPINEVEKLVAGNIADLESVNISALSHLAKSEAELKRIKEKE